MGSYNMFARATKRLWRDKATIYGKTNVRQGAFDDSTDSKIIENEPCKVITTNMKPNNQGIIAEQSFDAILLIRNGIDIPKGAEIHVDDINGQTRVYKQSSGGYTNYLTHQEVGMKFDAKA